VFRPQLFPPSIEPLVRLIEDSPREDFVRTICKTIGDGREPDEVLLASGLAVVRSCDIPPVHHGGSVHPFCGLYPARQLNRRLHGVQSLLPVVQHAVLANQHIHHDTAGPFILPEERQPTRTLDEESAVQQLRYHIDNGESYECEALLLQLLRIAPAKRVWQILLDTGIAKNEFDDHLVLMPVYAWRVLDPFGWGHAPYFLRAVIRFVTRLPAPPGETTADELIRAHALDPEEIGCRVAADETAAISRVSAEIGNADAILPMADILARALADGLSLDGAGEALSVGASHLLLRSRSLDALGDVHLNTTANARRFLIRQPFVDPATRLRALLGWATGPDNQRAGRSLGAFDLEGSQASRPCTLEALEDRLVQLPYGNDQARTVGGERLCGDGVSDAVSMAAGYLESGGNPAALIRMLGEVVCRDESSEFHLYKHHQAMVEEFASTRPELAPVHLLAAVKATAISRREDDLVYRRALEALPEAA
jgi:hypothetical protein